MYTLIKNDSVMSFDPITRIHVGGQELLVRNEIAKADSVFISAPNPLNKTFLYPVTGLQQHCG